jgi:hypothetical protein
MTNPLTLSNDTYNTATTDAAQDEVLKGSGTRYNSKGQLFLTHESIEDEIDGMIALHVNSQGQHNRENLVDLINDLMVLNNQLPSIGDYVNRNLL